MKLRAAFVLLVLLGLMMSLGVPSAYA